MHEGRSLGQPNLRNSGHLQTRSGKPSGYRPKGKGKTYKAYTADAWYYDKNDYYEEDRDQEEGYNEASYQAFEDEAAAGYQEDPEGDGEEYEDYALSESEAIALNFFEELEESSEAACCTVAFGSTQVLVKQKARVKASPRSALGHCAGDPECKFPPSQGGRGKVHLAIIADGGLSIPARNESAAAFMVRLKSSAAKPLAGLSAAADQEPGDMVMEEGDKKFYMGYHRNETYSEVAKTVEFIKWLMAQSDLSTQNQDFLTWFNRYYTIQDGGVRVRSSLGLPEGAYVPRPRKTGIRKAPPNPPLAQKCTLCKDFAHAGSTMNFIRSTCSDCGHVEQKPCEVTYTHDPTTCRHEDVDRRVV